MRNALTDKPERSALIWGAVRQVPAVKAANVVMLFNSITSEPTTSEFLEWCVAAGKTVVFPEDNPPANPESIDVAIVPGVAFTAGGGRLGQGGGWYDRFLPSLRPDCVTIGVGFAPQLVDDLPAEPHDVVLDFVITDQSLSPS